MELRSLEKEMNEMAALYESLRRSNSILDPDTQGDGAKELQFPPLAERMDEKSGDDGKESKEKTGSMEQTERSLEEILSVLESQRKRTTELEAKMEKYRKRLVDKDPVTGNPRYGEATSKRVQKMLSLYAALLGAMQIVFGEATNEEGEHTEGEKTSAIVEGIRRAVEQQKEFERQREIELAEKKAKEESEKKSEEQRRLEEIQKAEEAALLARRQEQQELAQRAEVSRRAREAAEQARLEAARRQQEEANRWAATIPKGPDGVRQQLATMREKTDPVEHAVAINALHTLFSQIVSHPEEPNFRRVRRDHPRFNEEIGRHPGGREVLVAAGFRLGAIDDVPCFISTEPNIENDMDGWSAWFDLLKATLAIIEKELMK